MIYFDNAATSFPKPRAVRAECSACLRKYCGNPGRGSHKLALSAAEKIYDCRTELAEMFRLEHPENIVFTLNATHAINIAIKSMLKPGGRVLISDLEHNSVLRPLSALAKSGYATYELFPTDGDIIENIKKLLSPHTEMIVCTHVSNVTGKVLPIYEIGRLCRDKGIKFIVDASQSAGHVPIDFTSAMADALCAPGHKGLFGIQGCGFVMYASPDDISTVIEGGNGANSLSEEMPEFLPERLEAGTLPTPAIAALLQGARFVRRIGYPEIEYREERMTKRASEMIAAIPGSKIYSCDGGSIVTFNIGSHSSEETASVLDRAGICVRAGYHCSPLAHRKTGTLDTGAVRMSFSCFNKPRELEKFYRVMRDFAK